MDVNRNLNRKTTDPTPANQGGGAQAMGRVGAICRAGVVEKHGSGDLSGGMSQLRPDTLPLAWLQMLSVYLAQRFTLDIGAVLDRYTMARPALHSLVASHVQFGGGLHWPTEKGNSLSGGERFRLEGMVHA